ncbi:MAG: hypothetical protein RLZZ08_1464 [Pseudomonadota bacterium]|jgi:hypothetical protein
MTLADIQRQFETWLVTGNDAPGGCLGPDAAAGLGVYLNNYRSQLVDCLHTAFPCAVQWIGEDDFLAACRAHIMGHPPHHWNLDSYPASFAAQAAALFPDSPVSCELLELEQALSEAMVAADRAPLTRESLPVINWEAASITHAAGGRIVLHRTNAAQIHAALVRGQQPPEAVRQAEPAHVLIWRERFTPCFRVLDADEAAILASLEQPQTFIAICERLVDQLGESAGIARAGALLARWADDQAVSVID